MEEPPGPPFNQMDRGALTGSLRASKNQKEAVLESDNRTLLFSLTYVLIG
jgi:hypothetical protein